MERLRVARGGGRGGGDAAGGALLVDLERAESLGGAAGRAGQWPIAAGAARAVASPSRFWVRVNLPSSWLWKGAVSCRGLEFSRRSLSARCLTLFWWRPP